MDGKSISRRGFAWRAALLTGGPAVVSGEAAPSVTAGSSEEEARLANIVRQYGARLSAEQVKHLQKILAENGRMLTAVRNFSIANGDPPASVLKLHPDSQN